MSTTATALLPARTKPFAALIERVKRDKISRWSEIEDEFLEALSRYDADFVARPVETSDYNNGKGDPFNDLILLLVQNRTGKEIGGRGVRLYCPGRTGTHQIDIAYPSATTKVGRINVLVEKPEFIGETKMAGTPSHAKSSKSAGTNGRGLNSDVNKRVGEVTATSIDTKAHFNPDGLCVGKDGLAPVDPFFAMFYAGRISNDADLRQVPPKLIALRDNYVDAVGAFFYRAVDDTHQTTYVKVKSPEGLTIDDVIDELAAIIVASPRAAA